MRKIALISVVLFVFILTKNALSWDDSVTHKDLSRYAADSSFLRNCIKETDKNCDYLKNLGFNKGLIEVLKWDGNKTIKEDSIKNWLAEGAELEDKSDWGFPIIPGTTTRSFNHFHNPLKPWEYAGLNDLWTGESSLLWAQDRTNQQNIVERDQTWQQARDYFYLALMSATNSLRQENFARMFKGLGHQMHLLQDTSVPDHVRNDAHPEDAVFGRNPFNGSAYFESWAKERFRNVNELKTFAPNPDFPNVSFNVSYNGLAPITQLYDTDEYNGTNPSVNLTQGLAEYTNANFFSNDTIFAAERYSADNRHYFPYPKKSSTDLQNYLAGTKPEETVLAEDGDTDTGIWISKNADGENVSHFVRSGKLTKWYYNILGEGGLFYQTFYRDDECNKDYAKLLLPRAVGYSAGLLDYFFRGSIDITLPGTGVYAQTNDPDEEFTGVTLLAQNTTPNNEEMNDGSIELVVKYRLAIDDPFKNYPEDYPFRAAPEYSYIVVPEVNGVRSIPRDNPIELTFDLSNDSIPLHAIDVYLQLIYHGRLGNEEGAVVVGFKDISEPTPVDFSNDMDRICLNGSFYTAGSPEAIDQVDTNNNGIPTWDIYPHDLSNIYFRTSPANNQKYASPTDYNFVISSLNAGDFTRAFYILTDYNFTYSSNETWTNSDPMDPWGAPASPVALYSGTAIKNQTEYIEDPDVCAPLSAPCYLWWYPTFLSYRDREIWWGASIMYINRAYPQGSECSCYQGVLRNCMSSAQTMKAADNASKSGDNTVEMNNAQMLPLAHKQRRIPADR